VQAVKVERSGDEDLDAAAAVAGRCWRDAASAATVSTWCILPSTFSFCRTNGAQSPRCESAETLSAASDVDVLEPLQTAGIFRKFSAALLAIAA
jgi:hypothetical protein